MTMHLLGPGMTTTNYKKRKKKPLTVAQLNQMKIDWKRHNKDCRRKHIHAAQFENLMITLHMYVVNIKHLRNDQTLGIRTNRRQ